LSGGAPDETLGHLQAAGFITVRQQGTAAWRRGGVDVEAVAFLDGGISIAVKDGFVAGGLDGCSVVGDAAMAWVCETEGFRRPRTASQRSRADLEMQLFEQTRSNPDALEAASRALLCSTIPELADAEVRVPQLLGWS